jgi:hypothetical protein
VSLADEVDALRDELAALRRQNRILGGVAVASLVGVVALFIRLGPGVQAHPPEQVTTHLLEARELRIVDGHGTPRIHLDIDEGSPALTLTGADGSPRVWLRLNGDRAAFTLGHPAGAHVEAGANGQWSDVRMTDPQGRQRLMQIASGQSGGAMSLIDGTGRSRFILEGGDAGARITFLSSAGDETTHVGRDER